MEGGVPRAQRDRASPALCPGVLQVVVKQVPHRHDLLAHAATAGAGAAAPPPEPAAADTEVERLRAEVQRMRVAEQRAHEERDAALARQMHETELRQQVCVCCARGILAAALSTRKRRTWT